MTYSLILKKKVIKFLEKRNPKEKANIIKTDNISSVEETILKYDVVGPICESSDCFGKAVELPVTKRGDFIAIRSAGAYGEVMSSKYNLRDDVRSVCI